MKAKQGEHTPGPWEYSRRTDRPPYNYHVSQTGGGHIVTVHDEGGGYVHESNAALIASAPELFEVLEVMCRLLKNNKGFATADLNAYADKGRDIIAKVRGRHE